MGKGAESRFAVVGSHAAGADAPERQIRNKRLQHHIVEAHPTRTGLAQQLLLMVGVTAE